MTAKDIDMNGPGRLVLLVLLLLLACSLPAAAQDATPAPVRTLAPPSQTEPDAMADPVIVRDYAVGDSGDDVYLFKLRLQYLGYFKESAELSDSVSAVTLERVNQLLADNGMEPVEIITREIQEMIYGRNDLAIIPTPAPTPTRAPLIAPVGAPELPPLDSEGFLADADGEYVFSDEDDGLWYYISRDLYINIRRYKDMDEENIWYEAEIRTRGEERMTSLLTDPLAAYRSPVELARKYGAVLAFTDDFFTERNYGAVIRDGKVYRNYIRVSSKSFPLGDELAVFADGSMLTFDYNAYSADDYLEMGAVHVLSFGPWLIRDGAINPRLLTGSYMHYHDPRMAMGMIEPGHYFVMAVDGRYDGALGAYIEWVAWRMKEVGVTEAINLDGGGTAALVFMGTQISRVASAKPDGARTRRVSSMLGFGASDSVPN